MARHASGPSTFARIVILISGRGSNMMALVEAIERQGLPVEVAGVVSNRPEAPGLAWAQGKGIPCRTVDHHQFADRAAFDVALGDAIDELAPPSGRRGWCWPASCGC